MFLSSLLLWIAAVAGVSAMGLHAFARINVPRSARGQWVAAGVSLVVIGTLAAAIALRSRNFGVDTVAYVDLFQPFCERHELVGYDLTYLSSVWLLDIAMFDACNVEWLPAVWVGLIVIVVVAGGASLSQRLCVLALLLVSLVGIELTTNALRQGLSVAVMLSALSYWRTNRALAVGLGILSLTLHASASLAALSVITACLNWRPFLLSFVAILAVIIAALQTPLTFILIDPLLLEITKYLGHEGDEIGVRILAFSCVVAALVAPMAAMASSDNRARLLRAPDYQIALRLAVCCVPPLMLPYFGYRFIYGLFPMILWFVVGATMSVPLRMGRAFAATFVADLMILFVWTYGSSYMQTVPFYV